jgi:hypothetical protein
MIAGLGTWQAGKGEVGAAVKAAIKAGYRHFGILTLLHLFYFIYFIYVLFIFFNSDCAEIYGNEAEIGEAFKSAFDEGLVKRYVQPHIII